MNARQWQGAGMMLVTLGILVVPGVVTNNLQNNGLISSSQTLTCTTTNGGTCVLAGSVGCQASAANCQLQGSSLSFLNSCSPFTSLFTLDYTGFISSFFTKCNGKGVSQTLTSPIVAGTSNSTSYTIGSCTTLAVNVNLATAFYIWIQLGCKTVTPTLLTSVGAVSTAYGIGVGTGGSDGSCVAGNWNGVIGNTTVGSLPSPSAFCIQADIVPAGCTTNSCVTVLHISASCLAYGDYYPGTTNYGTGGNTNRITSVVCSALAVKSVNGGTGGPVNGITIGQTLSSSSALGLNTSSIISFLLSLVGAALLIFIGLGIGGGVEGGVLATGGGVTLTTNPQGSKMAQTFGIALLLWAPLFSEFSTWFSSGFFPFGLDGAIDVVLTAVFFIGTYLLSQSGTAASQ